MNNTKNINDNVPQETPVAGQDQTQAPTDVAPDANNVKAKAPAKKPVYKKWWFWVIIVFVVLIIGAAASGGNTTNTDKDSNKDTSTETKKEETTTETSTESNSTETENTSSAENAGGYKVGETMTFKDSKVTITGVTRNFDTGNIYVHPESGKEYIKIDVSFTNTTTSNKTFYTSDWQLQDGNGVINNINFSGTAMIDGGFTSSVELAGGGQWSGSMIFEVPADDTNLQLQYKPSWLSKTTVINL